MVARPPLVLHHALQAQLLDDGRLELSLAGSSDTAFRMAPMVGAVLSLFDGVRSLAEIRAEAARRQLSISQASLEALVHTLEADGVLQPIDSIPTRTLPGARVVCARCTDCCHLLVGPLSSADVQRVEELDWEGRGQPIPQGWLQTLGEPPDSYLSQTDSGACFFLDQDGLCRIHRHFGAEAKPTPCRLFPLLPIRRAGVLRLGVSYECPSQHRAEQDGRPVEVEGAELKLVVDEATQDWSMLADVDPGGRLWSCVAGPPPPEGPEEALFALCQVASALDAGEMRLPDLLELLLAQGASQGEGLSADRFVSDHQRFRGAVEQLLGELMAGELRHLPSLDEEASRYLLGYLQNQVFLGEPAGRLGVGIGVSVWVLSHVLGVRLAAAAPEAVAERPLGAPAMAYGLSKAISGLRCVDLVGRIDGAGSALIADLVDTLRTLTGSQPPA